MNSFTTLCLLKCRMDFSPTDSSGSRETNIYSTSQHTLSLSASTIVSNQCPRVVFGRDASSPTRTVIAGHQRVPEEDPKYKHLVIVHIKVAQFL